MTGNTTTADGTERIDLPELPNGWEWWTANTSSSHYTRWFGTDFHMGGHLAGKHGLGGYDGEVYWDEGGEHHVAIYPITGTRDSYDYDLSEYPAARGSYDSKQAAHDAVPELIDQLG